jgi:small subunit ribosomal protein S13
MARIANVNIPVNKKIVIALTYIYGIGLAKSQEICKAIDISPDKKVKDLDDNDLIKLRTIIEKSFKVEGDLRREVSLNIKKKKDIRCYQGLRHIKNLPVRGQNTHSNARTRKGKKSLPVAGKKKASKK